MIKKYIIYITVGLCFYNSMSQTVNEGLLSVHPNTDISTVSNFNNDVGGFVLNDGNFYFYSHFMNEGVYTYDFSKKSSYAIFQPYDETRIVQQLTGKAQSEFHNVLFNNPASTHAFHLKNDLSIGGTANFQNGIIQIDSLKGALVFQQGAKAINTSDKSHADGEVEKIGKESFIFPIGNEGMYRFAEISAPDNLKDSFLGKYYFKNSNKAQPHFNKVGAIQAINNQEYWTIERADNTKTDIILTLSWDSRTTPIDLLKNAESDLRIVRWDAKQKLWVDEGGIVDIDNRTITTPTTVDGYGIFTFGVSKPGLILAGDIVIYNSVSPNGDGYNDHFVIDKIERFPNNKVEIFNRWGVKVFSTKRYNNQNNNFAGFSSGRVTIDNNIKLPTGTYFYIIEYEYTDVDTNTTQTIKKTGYLHLDNN